MAASQYLIVMGLVVVFAALACLAQADSTEEETMAAALETLRRMDRAQLNQICADPRLNQKMLDIIGCSKPSFLRFGGAQHVALKGRYLGK